METRQTRWEKAQTYEKAWWQERIDHVDPAFYRTYAATLLEEIKPYLEVSADTHILEIGSGAAGIITFLESEHKAAVDPLEHFYGTVEAFTEARDPRVRYATAKGEALPFEARQFDLVIIDNVLDHCEDPRQVFAEMKRVLKPGGMVYLRLNLYHAWGKFIRSLVELLQIDEGHPYTFTSAQLQKLIERSGFQVLRVRRASFAKTWLKELTSGQLKDLAKALTFATRSKTLFLLQKPEE